MKNEVTLPIGRGARNRKDTVTMRIKKTYFDSINRGEKTSEYRDFTPFYQSLFKTPPNFLYLHYQGPTGLVCEVKSIKKIKTPAILKQSKIPFGEHVFKIDLGNCKEVNNGQN